MQNQKTPGEPSTKLTNHREYALSGIYVNAATQINILFHGEKLSLGHSLAHKYTIEGNAIVIEVGTERGPIMHIKDANTIIGAMGLVFKKQTY